MSHFYGYRYELENTYEEYKHIILQKAEEKGLQIHLYYFFPDRAYL